MRIVNEKFGIARLVWQEAPKPPSAWGPSHVEAQHKEDREKRGDHEPKPPPPALPSSPDTGKEKPSENPEDEKPIDPGDFVPMPSKWFGKYEDNRTINKKFPKLDKKIIAELDRIEEEEFTSKSTGLEPTEIGGCLTDIVKDMKEAMLYRATVLHWKRKTLYDKYREQMHDLYTRSYGGWASRAARWTGGKLHALVSDVDRVPRLPGQNPALDKRRIKPERRGAIIAKLRGEEKKIEDDMINNKKGIKNTWYKPWRWTKDYNGDLHDFLKEEYFPFYRQYQVDVAIMENEENEERVLKDYRTFLEEQFEPVLK